MSELLTTLPRFDRTLLRVLRHAVPKPQRGDWLRNWHAELWHLHHGRRTLAQPTANLVLGLTCDALWLRSHAWKRALAGTPTLCLAGLASACLIVAFMALMLTGSVQELVAEFTQPLHRFLFEAVLVALVTFATTSRRPVHQASGALLGQLRRKTFFLFKSALLLLLAFLLAADFAQPLHVSFPAICDLSQLLLAAIFSIAGLRWAFDDQDARCKHCLLALESPAHVGRPSRNLLEWNGTERVCRQGHGRLTLPELETSWCGSGQWLDPHQA